MKELEVINKDEVSEVRQKHIKKQIKLIGRNVPGDGHKVFELNMQTLIITEIDLKGDISFQNAANGNMVQNKKVIMKEGCMYVTALNQKNAINKFNKRLKSGKLIK